MALGQLLDQIRNYYISRFIDAINEHTTGDNVSVVHETAFCNGEGEIITEGKLALPLRGDLLVIRDGVASDSFQIDTDEMLVFDPIIFDWPDNDLNVELHPFQWNWMQLQIFGLQPEPNWQPMRDWFFRWFQDYDPPVDELLGGVHFLSDPEDRDGYAFLSLDLGTAPVECFEELLDVLGEMGTLRVEIGQFTDQP